jgi:hypothetical protein
MNFKGILIIILFVRSMTFAQIKMDSSELVFTRKPFFMGMGALQKFKIKNNDTLILKIMENQQRSVFVPSGKVNLTSRIIRKSTLNFQCSPDTIYYISVKVGGLFLDKINLKVTKKIGKLR